MRITALALAICLTFPACASQNPTALPIKSPYQGLAAINDINNALDTLQTNSSGATCPSTPVDYQWCADTSNNYIRFYDGTNWLLVAKFSGGQWVPVNNGVPEIVQQSTGATNAYEITLSPSPAALVIGQRYSFIANAANTGAATLTVNGFAAQPLTKYRATALDSGDISAGGVVETVYDGTQFQILSQLSSSSSGSVTRVSTNDGLTGGDITNMGAIGLASIANNTFLANTSGGSAAPVSTTLETLLNSAVTTTQGNILYRGASGWAGLAPGTANKPLISTGTTSVPSYANLPTSALNGGSGASSTTFWRGDGAWATPTVTNTGFGQCTIVTVAASGGTSTKSATATCAAGYTIFSGGCISTGTVSFLQPGAGGVVSGNGWYCVANVGSSWTMSAKAVCCK